jgi:hypothetical protein
VGIIRLAILVPDRNSPGVTDQFLGARLAVQHSGAGNSIAAEEIIFKPEDSNDLKRCLVPLKENFSGVIGATHVPESMALGELSERLGLLCFVANNNPSVWNGKRNVFHIGIPSAQTAAAVAFHLAKLGIRKSSWCMIEPSFKGGRPPLPWRHCKERELKRAARRAHRSLRRKQSGAAPAKFFTCCIRMNKRRLQLRKRSAIRLVQHRSSSADRCSAGASLQRSEKTRRKPGLSIYCREPVRGRRFRMNLSAHCHRAEPKSRPPITVSAGMPWFLVAARWRKRKAIAKRRSLISNRESLWRV